VAKVLQAGCTLAATDTVPQPNAVAQGLRSCHEIILLRELSQHV
jgi:hypothetical protein